MEDDLSWMQRALEWARRAQADGEVPVGAVLVREGKVLAEAGNRPIGLNDPTAHAEILALRQAARREGNYRLPGTTLYVTLEPCLMCTGALVHARVARLVFAARDNLRPDSGRVEAWLAHPWLNHRVQVEQGPLGEEAAALLQRFFRERRS